LEEKEVEKKLRKGLATPTKDGGGGRTKGKEKDPLPVGGEKEGISQNVKNRDRRSLREKWRLSNFERAKGRGKNSFYRARGGRNKRNFVKRDQS